MGKAFPLKRLWVDPAFQGRLLACTASDPLPHAVAAFHAVVILTSSVLLSSALRPERAI